MSFPPESKRVEDVERVFVSLVPDIERAARVAVRRGRLDPAEADDVASDVKVRLLEDDYAALRRFDGRSELLTYVVTIVHHILIDRRRHDLGRYRTSPEAKAGGPMAERLERLLSVDGLTLDQAIETICTSDPRQDHDALRRIAAALPTRTNRRFEGDRGLESVIDARTADPERQASAREATERLQAILDNALRRLPPAERIAMRLHFEDDTSVADTARMLDLDQPRLYRRIKSWTAGIRTEAEAAGLRWEDLRGLVESGRCSLRHPRARSGK